MPSLATQVKHPYIVKRRGVCGGKPIITGTRVSVWAIAGWSCKGYSAEKIQREIYPSLGLAEIYDALSYFHDHKEGIDRQLAKNSLSSREARRRQAQWRLTLLSKVG
ncbi:MAG: DUF433 domain-containing protein [Deltaproteobacteria bacterium]|nr:DUF433 domain-containing protein [Deltaproteobacteria bacterium]